MDYWLKLDVAKGSGGRSATGHSTSHCPMSKELAKGTDNVQDNHHRNEIALGTDMFF